MSPSRKRALRMPNPWPPDTIDRLVEQAVTVPGLAIFVYKLIVLWVDHRKGRKIRIRRGEVELVINGPVSATELRSAINEFRKLTKGADDEELKITATPRAGRSLSPDMAMEAVQSKAGKKGGER